MSDVDEIIDIREFDHPGDEPLTAEEFGVIRMRAGTGKRNCNFLMKPMTPKERSAGLSYADLIAGRKPSKKKIEKAKKARKRAAVKVATEKKKKMRGA